MTRNSHREKPSALRHSLDADQVFREYYDQVYRLGLSMSGNSADAQDIAQESFLAIFAGLARFRGDAALSTWIYRITVRSGTRWLARKGTTAERPKREAASSQALPLDLMKALGQLPPASRMVIALVSIEGLSHQEAGEVLGIATGTVASRLHHARARLATLLG